jgi:Ser/Thr protein kinase RdoA (MazF antagonist)
MGTRYEGGALDLMRLGENAIFHVLGSDCVLRVARPGKSPEQICAVLRIAGDLAAAGLPVIEPLKINVKPLPEGTVTFWQWYPDVAPAREKPALLARLLKRFHAQTSLGRCDVRAWAPFEKIDTRLMELRSKIPAALIDDLARRRRAVAERLSTVQGGIGECLLHGDAHTGNVLRFENGDGLLADLDEVCWGPREWDLIPTLVSYRHGMLAVADYDRFVGEYGYDVRDSRASAGLVSLRELGMITWLAQQWHLRPEVDTEIELRLMSLQSGDETPWTPF